MWVVPLQCELKEAGVIFICLFFHDVSLRVGSVLEAGGQREAEGRGRTGAAGAFTVVASSRRAGGGVKTR